MYELADTMCIIPPELHVAAQVDLTSLKVTMDHYIYTRAAECALANAGGVTCSICPVAGGSCCASAGCTT